ncbi:MAG: GFA family protein [Pseudomonadales bacterium]|nr:GFA family protein [Pseudomonadales bacterium]
MELTGRCYCGDIHYRAKGDAVMKAQCHCRECQYITGGEPNIFIGMPTDGFTYTKGEPKDFTRSDLDNPVTRQFCSNCGTHLATRPPGFPAVIVKVGTLDDPAVIEKPDMAIFMVDAQPFHQVPEGVATFDRMPG